MGFDTTEIEERALRAVDDQIRVVLRSRWGSVCRVRDTPTWEYRTVTRRDDLAGSKCVVTVKGRFKARRRDTWHHFACDMVVNFSGSRRVMTHLEVTAGIHELVPSDP